jgi:hypothetical protein
MTFPMQAVAIGGETDQHRSEQDSADQRDAGVTLIELLVYCLLSVIVLGLVGTMLIQSLKVQTQVQGTNSAASTGQLVSSSVNRGVRNSTTVSWASSASGELLVARTNNSVGTVSCGYKAWYYSISASSIYTTTSSSAITEPNTSQLATWTVLATGIQKSGATFIFTVSGLQVDIRFNVVVGTETPLPFKTTAISNGTTLESVQCS